MLQRQNVSFALIDNFSKLGEKLQHCIRYLTWQHKASSSGALCVSMTFASYGQISCTISLPQVRAPLPESERTHLYLTSVRDWKLTKKEQKKLLAQGVPRWRVSNKEPVTSCPTMTLFHSTVNCKVWYFCGTIHWAVVMKCNTTDILHLSIALCICSCTQDVVCDVKL